MMTFSRAWLADRLYELLVTSKNAQDSLARHLQAALQVSAEEAQALLWSSPRFAAPGSGTDCSRRLCSQLAAHAAKDPGASPGATSRIRHSRASFEAFEHPRSRFRSPV